jgi:hypothetical protein
LKAAVEVDNKEVAVDVEEPAVVAALEDAEE